jgi:hypothetical protein
MKELGAQLEGLETQIRAAADRAQRAGFQRQLRLEADALLDEAADQLVVGDVRDLECPSTRG